MARGSNISVGIKAWSDRINAAWRKSTESVIEAGKLLVSCKQNVSHGEFQKMLETELDFEPRTAQRLMAIAGDERITTILNATPASLLPRGWTTLYELTRLSDDEFQRSLEDGTIHKDMERSDATKIRRRSKSPTTVTEAEYQEVGPNSVLIADDPKPNIEQEPREISDDGWADMSPVPEPVITGRAVSDGPATNGATGHSPEFVTVSAPPNDPVIACATGIELLLLGIGEAEPAEVAERYPADMPLFSDDLSNLVHWLSDLELAFRAIHGAGNAAAMEADAR